MGINESIDLIPVWSGWSTDFLDITHGAILSTGYCIFAVGSFPPSMMSPSPLTTLPRYSSPTPIENVFPVFLTICPCCNPFSVPRINTQT